MVDIPVLIQVLAPLEGLIKRVRASGVPLRPAGVDALTDAADLVDHVMDQFDAPDPRVPDVSALAAQIVALRDEQPEATVAHILYEPDPQPLEDEVAVAEPVAEGATAPVEETFNLADTTFNEAELDAFLNGAEPVSDDEGEADGDAPIGDEPDADDLLAAEAPQHDDLVPADATPESLEAELEAMLSGELAEREASDARVEAGAEIDEQIPGTELAPIETTDDTADLTADLLASFEGFQVDTPAIEVKPILAYDADEDAAWRALLGDLADDGIPSPVASAPVEETLPQPVSHDGDVLHTDDGLVESLAHGTVGEAIDETPSEEEGFLADEASAAEASPTASAPTEHIEAGELVESNVHFETDEPVVIEDQSHEAVAPSLHTPVDEPVAALVPELSPYADIDPDLLEVFVEEGREILDHADAALASWRVEPQVGEHVTALQRDLHTLKGSARMAGLAIVGDLAHAMEALLDAVAGGQRDSDRPAIEATEVGFDRLHGMIQSIAQGRAITLNDADIEPFARLAGAPIAPDTLTAESYREEREAAVMVEPAPIPTFEAVPEPDAIPVIDRDLPELLPEIEEEELAFVAGTDPRSRRPARQPGQPCRRSGDLPFAPGTAGGRLPLQPGRARADRGVCAASCACWKSRPRRRSSRASSASIARAALTMFDPLELDRYSQLQQYSRALAESVSDLVSIQNMLDELTRQSETLLIQQSRVSTELQDGLLRTRMLPFDTMVPNLRRTLRQAAQEAGQECPAVSWKVRTAKWIATCSTASRRRSSTCCATRSPTASSRRTTAQAPASRKVRCTSAWRARRPRWWCASATMGAAWIARRSASAASIAACCVPEPKPTDNQLLSLITQPGFSTASKVTQLAGRGVGMDVVANEIKQLGGSLSIESQKGKGTTFVLRLPFTLAVTQAILVRIGEATFAIPMTSVQGVARVNPDELAHRMAEDEPSFQYGDEDYSASTIWPSCSACRRLAAEDEQQPLLLTRAGDLRAAIRIDAVIGSREIVVKSVGPQISSVPGLLGATIMGDGSVLIILDLAPLVRHGITRREQRLAEGLSAVQAPVIEEVRVKPLVMVVDDSITMRKVTGRVLERHEYEVSHREGRCRRDREAARARARPDAAGHRDAAHGRLRAGHAHEGRPALARRADHHDHLAQRRQASPARLRHRRGPLPRQAVPGGRTAGADQRGARAACGGAANG